SISNFFKYFMFDPRSSSLSDQDKKIATRASVLIGICTLGIAHAVCRCFFYDRTVVVQKPQDTPKVTAVAQKSFAPKKVELVIKPYDENPIQACGYPCNFSDLTARYQHHSKRDALANQFASLGQDFYFQRARGGGNCFYLSYASGVLHNLVRNQSIQDAISLLESKKELPGKAETISCLKELQQAPETIYQVLTSEEKMQPIITFLRSYAVDGVRNKLDAERSEKLNRPVAEWDADALMIITLDSGDVQAAIAREKQVDPTIDDKEAYCRLQERDGTDVQRPEIGILHNDLWPLAICLRMDDPLLTQDQKVGSGFLADYPRATSAVQVFRTGNHFDAMIPR
ncbi:MAG: hypothetical protein JSR37_02255, partial [Verrucomicrobia bacterium]|nr:hypothetical protein [Verrucomicrobiota bacterium]